MAFALREVPERRQVLWEGLFGDRLSHLLCPVILWQLDPGRSDFVLELGIFHFLEGSGGARVEKGRAGGKNIRAGQRVGDSFN